MITQDTVVEECPIAYYSWSLTALESKIGVYKQIALAAYWTLQKAQAIVGVSSVLIRSHYALKQLLSQEHLSKKPM